MTIMIKKQLFPALIIWFFILQPLFAADRGPIFTLSYAPAGYGTMDRPYKDGGNGTEKFYPVDGSTFTSALQFNTSIGYYYGFLQGDAGYSYSKVSSQRSNNDRTAVQDLQSAENSSFRIRFGKRWSSPGDTTYNWIYLGLKRMELGSSETEMDVAAYGYLIGYRGFWSMGLNYDIEFVFTADIYLGSYRITDYSSNLSYSETSRRYSISTGGALGIGLQYEPYNITLLLKGICDYDSIGFSATYNNSARNFRCSSLNITMGFEIIYSIPGIHYNKIPDNTTDERIKRDGNGR